MAQVSGNLAFRGSPPPAPAPHDPHAQWHRTATRLLMQVIDANAGEQRQTLRLRVACAACGRHGTRTLPAGSFSRTSSGAAARLGCDLVALGADGQPALCIDVRHLRAVDQRQAASAGLPWIELQAAEVLENPFHWNPVRRSGLRGLLCDPCQAHEHRVRAIAGSWGIPPDLYTVGRRPRQRLYVATIHDCWHCQEPIPLFWWPGVPFCRSEPPDPRPATVQFRHSPLTGTGYWGSVCPACGVLQDDGRVFLNGGPLSHLPVARGKLPWAVSPMRRFRDMLLRRLGA